METESPAQTGPHWQRFGCRPPTFGQELWVAREFGGIRGQTGRFSVFDTRTLWINIELPAGATLGDVLRHAIWPSNNQSVKLSI
jgi:hypothetical protein